MSASCAGHTRVKLPHAVLSKHVTKLCGRGGGARGGCGGGARGGCGGGARGGRGGGTRGGEVYESLKVRG